MKGGLFSLNESYESLKNFLESIGIGDIKEIKKDYISMKISAKPQEHAVSVILDIKKMKELMKKTGRNLDEAIAGEKVIYCYDSSRVLGCPVIENSPEAYYYNMGALTKNCDFVNLRQQELSSCWFQAVASTLTAMKHPEIVKKIADGEIELYDTKYRLVDSYNRLNEFQLKQINTIIEISKKFNIEFGWIIKKPIDLIIYNQMKEKVQITVLDRSEEVLGREMNSRIIKKINSRKKDNSGEEYKNPGISCRGRLKIKRVLDKEEIKPVLKDKRLVFSHKHYPIINNIAKKFKTTFEQLLKVIPRTDLKQEYGETDFSYIVRLINEEFEKINKYRETLEIRKDTIEKLRAEKKSIILYGDRKKSIDDSIVDGIKFSSREEMRREKHTEKFLDDTCKPKGILA
jgi:hypothetical protein